MALEVFWKMGEAIPEGDSLTPIFDLSFLSNPERTRLEGMRFPKRRTDWLSGRRTAKALLRACDSGLAELPADVITIANRASGAPEVIVNGDVYPGQLTISHSRDRSLAAWVPTDTVRIGADVEFIEPRADVFVEDYFTPSESNFVKLSTVGTHDQRVTLIWSAKEAALKALGIGLGVDTRQIEVAAWQEKMENSWNRFSIKTSLIEKKDWQGFWQLIEDYVITIAVCGINGDVKITPV
jgi:4'-phosphopantetheinyl transferase